MTIGSIANNPAMNPFNPMFGVGGVQNNQWVNINNVNMRGNPLMPDVNTSIRTAGNTLLGLFRGLGATFPPIRAATSDSAVAGITIDQDTFRTTRNRIPNDMRVEVFQTAQAQANAGFTLARAGREPAVGNFGFQIEIGGETHNFNVNVGASDTNFDIQRRMANAINDADIGIRASVATQITAGEQTSRITLTAAQTGTDHAFTVSGDMAEMMGLTQATQDARNAEFSINGGPVRTSQTNNVELQRGMTLNLRDVGQTEITFARDTEGASRQVHDIINVINEMLNLPRPGRRTGLSGVERLQADIHGALRNFSRELSMVGITLGREGLRINERTLSRAIEDGSINNVFNSNSPFINRMERIANHAARSNRYVNAPAPVPLNFNPRNAQTSGFSMQNAFSDWSFMNVMG